MEYLNETIKWKHYTKIKMNTHQFIPGLRLVLARLELPEKKKRKTRIILIILYFINYYEYLSTIYKSIILLLTYYVNDKKI